MAQAKAYSTGRAAVAAKVLDCSGMTIANATNTTMTIEREMTMKRTKNDLRLMAVRLMIKDIQSCGFKYVVEEDYTVSQSEFEVMVKEFEKIETMLQIKAESLKNKGAKEPE